MDGFCNCYKEKNLSLLGFVAVGVLLAKNLSNPKLKKFNYFGLLRFVKQISQLQIKESCNDYINKNAKRKTIY